MGRQNEIVSSLSVQLSMACIFCTAVYCFSEAEGLLFPAALIPYAVALYGGNRLLLRRERSLRTLVLVNAGVGLAFFAVLAAEIGWGSWAALGFAAVICLWLTVQGAGMALEAPELPRVILCLDSSLLVLVLFVGYGAAAQLPAHQLLPACIGCAGSLLGLMIRRVGGGLGARGWILIGAVFLALLALVLLLVGFAAAPMGQGVVAVWEALVAAVRLAGAALYRFLTWFLSLFPAPDGGWEPEMAPSQMELPEEMAEASSPVVLIVLAVLLAAGLLLAALWVLRMLGRLRVGGVGGRRAVQPQRRRASLREGLRRLLASWKAYFQLRIWLLRGRNTPEGLFQLLVHRCRMGPWRKRPGETPREFLLRLRRSAAGDPELAAALDALVPAVDAALYAPPGRTSSVPQARLIRRRVGASVRRQFIRERLEHLPWRGGRTQTAGREGA